MERTFTDDEGTKYTAELIPAKVVIRKQPTDAEAASVCCTVDAAHLAANTNKTAFGLEVYAEGAAPWARAISTELLGLG